MDRVDAILGRRVIILDRVIDFLVDRIDREAGIDFKSGREIADLQQIRVIMAREGADFEVDCSGATGISVVFNEERQIVGEIEPKAGRVVQRLAAGYVVDELRQAPPFSFIEKTPVSDGICALVSRL